MKKQIKSGSKFCLTRTATASVSFLSDRDNYKEYNNSFQQPHIQIIEIDCEVHHYFYYFKMWDVDCPCFLYVL